MVVSASTLSTPWSYTAPQRFLMAFTAIQVAAFLFFGALYALFPELREGLIRENNLLENLTVLLFGEGVLATAVILLIRERRRLPRRYWVVGALCALGFLEEVSYFQLLLPFSFPTLPNGATFDALSDLNRVMTITLDALGLPWPLVLGGALLLVVVMSWRRLLRLGRAAFDPNHLWFYVALAAGFVLVGTLIDTVIGPPDLFVFAEELCEMAAAMSLLFAAFAGLLHKRKDAPVHSETA